MKEAIRPLELNDCASTYSLRKCQREGTITTYYEVVSYLWGLCATNGLIFEAKSYIMDFTPLLEEMSIAYDEPPWPRPCDMIARMISKWLNPKCFNCSETDSARAKALFGTPTSIQPCKTWSFSRFSESTFRRVLEHKWGPVTATWRRTTMTTNAAKWKRHCFLSAMGCRQLPFTAHHIRWMPHWRLSCIRLESGRPTCRRSSHGFAAILSSTNNIDSFPYVRHTFVVHWSACYLMKQQQTSLCITGTTFLQKSPQKVHSGLKSVARGAVM